MKLSSLNKGLVLHCPLSEERYNATTKRVDDLTPYENHGTAASAANFVADRMGHTTRAMTFNGSSDNVRISDSASMSSVSAMSVFTWVKGVAQSSKMIITHYDTGPSQRAFRLASFHSSPYDKMRLIISDDGTFDSGHRKDYSSSIIVFDNTWHQVGFTFDAGSLKMYIDGIEDTNTTKAYDDAITTIHDSTADVMVGCFLFNDAPADFFGGSIADVRMYNRALSESEITFLYKQYNSKVII